MLLPGKTAGKTIGSPVATGSTRKHIRTPNITVPDWRNDFAHVPTMRATC